MKPPDIPTVNRLLRMALVSIGHIVGFHVARDSGLEYGMAISLGLCLAAAQLEDPDDGRPPRWV